MPGLSTGHTFPAVSSKPRDELGLESQRRGEKWSLLLFGVPGFLRLFPLGTGLCRELWSRAIVIRARLSSSSCSSSLEQPWQHGRAEAQALWLFSCNTQHREPDGGGRGASGG